MDWLSELYTRIEEQKLKQERTIQNLKQLFKPWPLPESDSNSKTQNVLTAEGGTADLPENKETSELTSAEKESLLMVEKVLSKAQKARNVQKKLEEPPMSRVKAVSHTEQSKTSEPKSIQKTNPKSSNSKVKTNNIKAEVATTKVTSSNAKERMRISERTQSSSGRQKLVPVYASAPFKTNPNLGLKLQTTYRAATSKTLSKSRGVNNSARDRGGGNKQSSDSGNVQSTRNSVTNNKVVRTVSDNQSVVDSTRCDSSNCDTDTVPSDVEESRCKLAEMCVTEGQRETDNEVQSNSTSIPQPPERKRFSLAKDGASLTVPGKIKKLLHQNHKLRQKLNAQTLTKKVSSPQKSDKFPVHFEHVFGNEEDRYVQLQARQARHILHTYTNLSSLLDCLNLDKISEDSHPADIYRCKKLMEYILITYQEVEELLHQIDFSRLQSVSTYNGDTEPQIPVPQSDSSHVWYTRLAPTGSVPQYGMKYTNYKQLESYVHTVYQIQWTQLQIDVMDTVATLLLPLLRSLDPSSSDFVHVLRAGYTLLSINHNHMPVVVKDTIQDESVLEPCEDDT